MAVARTRRELSDDEGDVVGAIIAEWCARLDLWSQRPTSQSTALEQVAHQPRGNRRNRRTNRFLLAQLNAKRSVRAGQAQWQQDGGTCNKPAERLLQKAFGLQLNRIQAAFANALTVELCHDASRYGKPNFELYASRSPEAVNPDRKTTGSVAAFLPPCPC